ncbi:trypsin-like peptidase domain-containing protein [uncultured Pseudoteredinibacter sp.]|uniref:S1C family serine protease n=1 Tax=uncultured Pseudoteredinibacter sp. TaxID=1641701 RepID=UPI002632D85E|nr:trypsin-like peptidase domain-containing protein [uncultured Pseudoteredinibacter sp.]
MKKLLDFVGLPVFAGVIIAVALLFLFPQLRQPSFFQFNSQQQVEQQGPASYSRAVRIAAPGVVNISTSQKRNFRDHPLLNDPLFQQHNNIRNNSPLGSGVVASEDGYILTNYHVIESANEIQVQFFDGSTEYAELVGTDPKSDLAVLKVNKENLKPLQVRRSEEMQIGDVVLAIGNPWGVGQTVSQGIISATDRGLKQLSPYTYFFQTDAAVNPGNSGGAVIDAYGKLVGISTAILNNQNATGISFAIPADYAMYALDDIVQYGYVVRGWLGFGADRLSAAAAASGGLVSNDGIFVTSITPGSPAEQAGLQLGDYITSINDIPLSASNPAPEQATSRLRPGSLINIDFIRQGQAMKTVLQVGLLRPDED